MKRLWTVEVEYVSAERKQKTGNGIVCSGSGKFVCKASLWYARKMVRAVNAHSSGSAQSRLGPACANSSR
jgi:hypothetical protein